MKWNRKYNYPTSTRAILNGKRHYNVNNEKLPSVTTILKETESIEKKESLAKWREKLGYKQAELITREATNRGNNLHHYLEMFLLGKLNLDLLGDNTIEKVMANQIIENGLRNKLSEIWGCEATLYFPGRFAGAADVVGIYEGKSTIIDFKNSNKPRQDHWNDEYYMQISGYISAHNTVYNTSINQGVVLLCTKDNFFQRFMIDGRKIKRISK